MAAEDQFQLFGDRSRFAIELCTAADQPRRAVPVDSAGTWGAWRLYVANVNLCRLQLDTDAGPVEAQEVSWFLAPLIRWLVSSWMPLLHETHLPDASGWGDRRPRWARLAYLAMLERSGDDAVRFAPWQQWASRHGLRFAAEGGIVPDVFFQRVGDEIELSWGDRVQPGGEDATFLVEDGVARAHVDDVAQAFSQALDWFFGLDALRTAQWSQPLAAAWRRMAAGPHGLEPLHWYLDSSSEPGRLSTMFLAGLEQLGHEPPCVTSPWLGALSPEIAMFGDLVPTMTPAAAVTLLTEYYQALGGDAPSERLEDLSFEEPAWTTTSPWENGYALALEVLEEADPEPAADMTRLEALLSDLSITVRDVPLGGEGPRGVALAGEELRPTIIVNSDHPTNSGFGRRFTLAHELCHILFDRKHARPLAHSSTPWAAPSVEQRANAFAAMLLMPPHRARRPENVSRDIGKLSRKLKVSKGALSRHLANIGEISIHERDGL